MTSKQLLTAYGLILTGIGLPVAIIHLLASPDDAPITPVQHVVAALANFFGPWSVAIVRVVDFPNAGLRSFSWLLAVLLTLLAAALIWLPLYVKRRSVQYACILGWLIFLLVWFGIGFRQIADGLL